jgi:hypothetical protein
MLCAEAASTFREKPYSNDTERKETQMVITSLASDSKSFRMQKPID